MAKLPLLVAACQNQEQIKSLMPSQRLENSFIAALSCTPPPASLWERPLKRLKAYPITQWGRLREGAESYAKALASDILR